MYIIISAMCSFRNVFLGPQIFKDLLFGATFKINLIECYTIIGVYGLSLDNDSLIIV